MPDIQFTFPWLLVGLAALPLILWLVRLTPPPPRRIVFPATWLLARLRPGETESAKSPWWLLLLRGLLAASLIVAAARPVLNGGGPLSGDGPLVLAVDNDWSAAADWPQRRKMMSDLVLQAQQSNQPVALLPLALQSGQPVDFRRASDSAETAAALEPVPWPVNRNDALARWADKAPLAPSGTPRVVWLSNGLAVDGDDDFIDQLRKIGPLTVVRPKPGTLPAILGDVVEEDDEITVTVRRLSDDREQSVVLNALDDHGQALARSTAVFSNGERETTASFTLPLEHRNRLARITTGSVCTAAEVALFDKSSQRHPVGLVAPKNAPELAARPLLGRHYYLERALAPIAEVFQGPVESLLSREKAVMILADPPILSPAAEDRLDKWMKNGGLILRFAGPNLETAKTTLLPVAVRQGNRSMGGALSWRDPPGIAPFTEESPFFGLDVPGDVKVSRQILADPNLMGDAAVWARLTDGTPLVTAKQKGDGWLVLFHVTSTTDWSNLPLSGLFVDLLDRLVRFSKSAAQAEPTQRLTLERQLNTDGSLSAVTGPASVIDPGAWSQTFADAEYPPGFYKGVEGAFALNLQDSISTYKPLQLPLGVATTDYSASPEKDISGWLWGLALLLLALDGFVSLGARSGVARASVPLVFLILLSMPNNSRADENYAIQATQATRLAYVVTGDLRTDNISKNGLGTLSRILTARSAAELGTPMAFDPEKDDPVFFPLVYWPVSDRQPDLSDTARERINRYLLNGGTILFDRLKGGNAAMEKLGQWLRLPPVAPISQDHVLTRTFYLIDQFPGRWTGDTVWIAEQDLGSGDGVAPVIIGSHDWAAAWATDEHQRPLFALAPGGTHQRERSYRFGVNLVMYVLTGNYKHDQVHLPAIMERLQR